MEEKRTQKDWMRIYENATIAILAGKCANEFLGEMSMSTLVDEALMGADLLVERLREREEEQYD